MDEYDKIKLKLKTGSKSLENQLIKPKLNE